MHSFIHYLKKKLSNPDVVFAFALSNLKGLFVKKKLKLKPTEVKVA